MRHVYYAVMPLSSATTRGRYSYIMGVTKVMGRIARFIGPRATTFKSVIRLSGLSRNREQSMRSVIRRKVRMLLAVRVEVVKQIALVDPFGTKESPPGAKIRKPVMMRVMEGMKRKLVSRNFKRPLTPCALMEVHLFTPLIANSSDGHKRSMMWNQRRGPEAAQVAPHAHHI